MMALLNSFNSIPFSSLAGVHEFFRFGLGARCGCLVENSKQKRKSNIFSTFQRIVCCRLQLRDAEFDNVHERSSVQHHSSGTVEKPTAERLFTSFIQSSYLFVQLLNLLEGLAPVQIDDPDPEEVLNMEVSKKPEEEEEEEQEDDVRKRMTPEHLHRLFLFCLTWSMGALLDWPSAMKFNTFVREKFTSLDWPNSRLYPDATVFDFVVNPDGSVRLQREENAF